MSQYNQTFDVKTNVGHCDLYFMVHWFCLISRRLFDIWASYFRIMCQYDPAFDLKINVSHCDLYFMVHWFCLIPWRLWCMNIILWDYESVWPDIWPQNKCRSLWPIFHGPVIFPVILKTAWSLFWIYGCVARSEACSLGMQAAPSSIPTSGTFFRGHSPSSTDSRRTVVSYWQKNVH